MTHSFICEPAEASNRPPTKPISSPELKPSWPQATELARIGDQRANESSNSARQPSIEMKSLQLRAHIFIKLEIVFSTLSLFVKSWIETGARSWVKIVAAATRRPC